MIISETHFSDAGRDHLAAYPVLVLVRELACDMDETLADRLHHYVHDGGTLVIDAEQFADRFGEKFLGVRLIAESGCSRSAICELDGQRFDGGRSDFRPLNSKGPNR